MVISENLPRGPFVSIKLNTHELMVNWAATKISLKSQGVGGGYNTTSLSK